MACAIGLSRILREDRATKDGFFEREKNPRNRNRGDFSCLSAGAFRLVLANQQFLNTSGLAGAVTQVVELGTADIAVALHFDGSDRRGVELERTFNAFAGRDPRV